ncbi:MAG: DNA repair exonuclease [Myxococcales bacterium]|nr:DNA repair exonuclease [Myxococcales bacterium]
MGLKFVHAADLHLDSPFRGLGADAAAAKLLPLLAGATFKAFERIVALCLRERVDFLALSGDLFDSKDRSVRARLALHRELSRLDAAQIRTFIVHGNHDPLPPGGGGLSLPPSVTVFGATWEEVAIRAEGTVRYRVQGISYPQERVGDDLSAFFSRRGQELTVGLLHANLGGSRGHADYAPCTAQGLADRGLDYWALGHVHTRVVHALPGGSLAVYPGNPQGRHVNEDGPRGCALVEIPDQGRPISVRFFPTDAVRWHRLVVDISALSSLDGLSEAATAAVERSCQSQEDAHAGGLDAHAVRLTLTGRGPLRSELSRAGAIEGLEDALAERFAALSPPVLLESVEDDTRPEIELSATAASGGLAGALAEAALSAPGSQLDELYAEAELDKLDAALARHGLARLLEEAPRLYERAALRALELLLAEEGR